jgi:YidC/Oxa1 family membrane protein insertase
MIKMNLVSGQLKEIQQRCGNDRERYNQEVQKFYTENNISPMGGCGWSMVPMLVLWPLYAIIRRPLKYMMRLTESGTAAVAEALGWTASRGTEFAATGYNELYLASMLNSGNLDSAKTAVTAAGTTATGMFVINFNFFGLDLSQVPSWKFWEGGVSWASFGLFLLPVISAVLSFLCSKVSAATNKMNKDQEEDATTKSTNRTMLIMMPLMSLWIGFAMPAGLCIYWISNSLLMMVQELLCGKMLKKDYEAAQKEMAEQLKKSKAAEKERRRLAAEKKAAAIAASKTGKVKKVQPQAKNKGVDLSASREGLRSYARGRAYDPDRYPITPYHDPDAKYKKKDETLEPLTEEEKALLAESGAAIPEETPAEVSQPAALEEVNSSTEAPAPVEVSPDNEGDYEAPYEDEESKE